MSLRGRIKGTLIKLQGADVFHLYPVERKHRGKGAEQRENLGAEREESRNRMKRSRGRQEGLMMRQGQGEGGAGGGGENGGVLAAPR